MIDKNGKVFGKINLIDLLIIIVIIVAAAFLGWRLLANNSSSTGSVQDITIGFYSTDSPNSVIEQFEVGAQLLDDTENNVLGTALSWETGEAYEYTTDTLGETIALHDPTCSSFMLYGQLTATVNDNGIVINGVRYAIGHTMVLYVGDCKVWVRIESIEY
ncbi:MAG: DUF4330 domain-containing protein [Oscillospiraceae bacterium]|nr:DUF4330 domain-containing protein [Oscillospiraceae bacterium]